MEEREINNSIKKRERKKNEKKRIWMNWKGESMRRMAQKEEKMEEREKEIEWNIRESEETDRMKDKIYEEKEMAEKIGRLYRISPGMFDERNDKINWIVRGRYGGEYFEITDVEEGIGFEIHYKEGFKIEEFEKAMKERIEKEKPKGYCYVTTYGRTEMICYPKIKELIKEIEKMEEIKSWLKVLNKQDIF